MRSLFRFLIILHCIGRYRLVDLLPARHVLRYRILLSPFYLYPKTSISRGERLRCAFEELGPIFIKFGQILSTRPDIIPADIIDELTLLQDKVPPFDPQEFKVIAEKSLGASLDLAFQSFEPTPLASASIAQVHGAKLHDGANVVIKVVRPGIERIIEQDTKLLDVLAHWVEKLVKEGKRLRPVDVVRDYRDTIFDELDLVKEAANGSQLKRNFERDSNLYVPEVYWELTHRNVLVMERIYGIPINDINALKRQETDMKLLAERGVEIFFKQVFEHNFFHADMHPGNVFVSSENPKSPSYIAIDMAIVGSLSKEDQFYLARNMLAMFRRDYRQVAELHVQSGWVPKETSVSAFESAIRSVCEPIFQKPLKDISFGDALINLFRTAQRFNMPVQPQLVLLQKTLLNIEGLGRQLYPELDLWETAHPFLERWLKKRMSPTSIAREIKYHFPEWLEQFPEVPGLIVDNLVSGKKSLEQNNSDEYLYAYLEKKEKAAKSRKNMLSFALFVSAVASYMLFPSMLQLSSHIISISLIVLSALIIAL